MSVGKALTIFNSFKALNGCERIVEVDGKQKSVFIPYQFDSKTCWNIAKNLNILRKHVADYEEARQLLSSGVDQKDPVALAKYESEVTKVLAEEVEVVGVLPLTVNGLNLDKNNIQPGLLADLADYITEDTVVAAK
jgi:hypothetical protein